MHYFFAPDLASNHFLPEEEATHAIRVLRLKKDDKIRLIDGKGGMFNAHIVDIYAKKCAFAIDEQITLPQRNFRLHMAIAPTKNMDRLEWFVEKAVEIGVDEITPVLCQCSERKVVKTDRLEKIVISAMKQSLKAHLPKVNEMTPIADVLKKATETQKFIAHCNADDEKILLKNACLTATDTLILIGPEGDFSPEEVVLAKKQGFQAISLGESRLRTETAGIVACHTVNLLNE